MCICHCNYEKFLGTQKTYIRIKSHSCYNIFTVVASCVEIISRCNKDSQETDSTVHNYFNLHYKRDEQFEKGVTILLPNNLTRDFSFHYYKNCF